MCREVPPATYCYQILHIDSPHRHNRLCKIWWQLVHKFLINGCQKMPVSYQNDGDHYNSLHYRAAVIDAGIGKSQCRCIGICRQYRTLVWYRLQLSRPVIKLATWDLRLIKQSVAPCTHQRRHSHRIQQHVELLTQKSESLGVSPCIEDTQLYTHIGHACCLPTWTYKCDYEWLDGCPTRVWHTFCSVPRCQCRARFQLLGMYL